MKIWEIFSRCIAVRCLRLGLVSNKRAKRATFCFFGRLFSSAVRVFFSCLVFFFFFFNFSLRPIYSRPIYPAILNKSRLFSVILIYIYIHLPNAICPLRFYNAPTLKVVVGKPSRPASRILPHFYIHRIMYFYCFSACTSASNESMSWGLVQNSYKFEQTLIGQQLVRTDAWYNLCHQIRGQAKFFYAHQSLYRCIDCAHCVDHNEVQSACSCTKCSTQSSR